MNTTDTESRPAANTAVHLRWMIRRDFPEVLAIANASSAEPWTEVDFLRALGKRNCIGFVAEIHDEVVGFYIYTLHKTHLSASNLAVHPAHRRAGVGRQMIAKLTGKLSARRRTRLVIPVHEANLDGQLFLRACGLKVVRIDREARGDGESEYVFECEVGDQL